MINSDVIQFRKMRNFSDKISVTFDFLKIAYKSLFLSLFYIAGPIALISSFGYVMYIQSLFDLMGTISDGSLDFPYEIISYALIFSFISVLAMLMVIVTVLEYVNIYMEKESVDISVNEVWDRVKISLPSAFLSMVLLIIIYTLGATIIIGAFVTLISTLGVGGAVFFGIFGGMGVVALILYFVFVLAIFFNIQISEKRGIGDFGLIFNRCFQLVKGNWWGTFGVIFIGSLIVGIVGGLLSAPAGIVQIGDILKNIDNPEAMNESLLQPSLSMNIYNGIVLFIRTLLQAFVILVTAFQYFHLVEKSEAQGLLGQIASIDTVENNRLGSTDSGDKEENEEY